MYLLIIETQFHMHLRQIEVVEKNREVGHGHGYLDIHPDNPYPIQLHHCSSIDNIRHHGLPSAITSDRGSQWVNAFWKRV